MVKKLIIMAETENENKIKHLEFIQLTITRMGVNSFLLKGWTVTIVAALFAFAANNAQNFRLTVISGVATVIFWLLDSYFLKQERLFRNLYDEVRLKRAADIDFSMSTAMLNNKQTNYFNCITSKTLVGFYLTLLGLVAIAVIVLKYI
jgi:hypothetical protein